MERRNPSNALGLQPNSQNQATNLYSSNSEKEKNFLSLLFQGHIQLYYNRDSII